MLTISGTLRGKNGATDVDITVPTTGVRSHSAGPKKIMGGQS